VWWTRDEGDEYHSADERRAPSWGGQLLVQLVRPSLNS
jgi:hypothetical protein